MFVRNPVGKQEEESEFEDGVEEKWKKKKKKKKIVNLKMRVNDERGKRRERKKKHCGGFGWRFQFTNNFEILLHNRPQPLTATTKTITDSLSLSEV